MNMILDVALVVLLLVCAFSGYRKGLILSISSVLVLAISVFVGGSVARSYGPELAQTVEPYIGWLSEDATDQVIAEMDETLEDIDANRAYEVIEASFLRMGIAEDAAQKLAEEGHSLMLGSGSNIRRSISIVFVDVLTYMLIFVVVFAVCAAALSIVLNVVGSSFAMPDLKLVDDIGGAVVGLGYGFVILLVLSWIMRYGAAFLPEDSTLISNSGILTHFINDNPLSSILGL